MSQGTGATPDVVVPMPNVYEDVENANDPPEPSVIRRASSYSDFYRIVQQELSNGGREQRKKTDKWNRKWEALNLPDSVIKPEDEESKRVLKRLNEVGAKPGGKDEKPIVPVWIGGCGVVS